MTEMIVDQEGKTAMGQIKESGWLVSGLLAILFFPLCLHAESVRLEEGQFGRIVLTSSSSLAPQSGNTYGPRQAFDGDGRTAWIEGAVGDGVGEWFEVRFSSSMKISRVYIANGYGKTKRSYLENGRIREASIATESGSAIITLADSNEERAIRLPPGLAGKKTRWIKLTILSVYPGNKFQDTALGEFRPDLEEHNYE